MTERQRLRDLLLANPLLDNLRLLVVVRGEKQVGLPANWEGNSSLPRAGYENEIAVLSDLRGESKLETVYRPPAGEFVGDLDLDFDGRRRWRECAARWRRPWWSGSGCACARIAARRCARRA